MENYKVEIFDENTFKSKGIVDTQIPEILVKTIQESLDKLNDELVRTPLVLNEEELTPSFGIMVKDEKGLHHLKYLINISLFEQAKEMEKQQQGYSEEEVLDLFVGILDADLTPMTLAKIKSKGLTPYYINDMDLIELSGPLKQKASWDYKPTEVFLFSPDDYDKIKKLSDNIKEMIELKKKQIELYKQYIPSVAIELTKKK